MTTAISTMNPAPPADMPMMAISDSTAEGGRGREVRVVLGIHEREGESSKSGVRNTRRREGEVRMAVSQHTFVFVWGPEPPARTMGGRERHRGGEERVAQVTRFVNKLSTVQVCTYSTCYEQTHILSR